MFGHHPDLDTNNLDLRTLHQVVDVLRAYPGAMILISHDDDFLAAIGAVRLLQLGER
jgi:ATPase subunit of ABC transporter with duplicated ATPase domains